MHLTAQNSARRATRSPPFKSQWFGELVWFAVIGLIIPTPALPQTPASALPKTIEFRAVDLGPEYRRADEKLVEYLNQQLEGSAIEGMAYDTYGAAILELASWDTTGRPYLARMTPYACVAAEMLGAKFEVLATYQSKATNKTTYNSYFVVNRQDVAMADPELYHLVDFLEASTEGAHPPTFFYHDRFSTSSYFLPALWFRSHGIFASGAVSRGVFRAELLEMETPSSTELVRKVAGQPGSFAAVWDGTKAKFDDPTDANYEEFGKRVRFLKLNNELPNDLLVCSTWLDVGIKETILSAIDGMEEDPASHIGIGDFQWWTRITKAPEARKALAELRQSAAEAQAPVVVRIEAPDRYREAARRAVRLASTEFVEYAPDFHKTYDLVWELSEIHDGAVELFSHTRDQGFKAFEQRFPISFTHAEGDLTKRIIQLIHSRMNRIRYIWPYARDYPTLLPEVDFSVPKDSSVKVQRIAWNDPAKNNYSTGSPFDATVAYSDLNKVKLTADDFGAREGKRDFDNPMSNVDYRAMLIRPTHESTISRVMTLVFLGTFGLAAVGAIIDLRRKPERAAPTSQACSLEEACLTIANELHDPWSRRKVQEAHVFSCNRDRLEEYIEELKTQGARPAFGNTVRIGTRRGIFAGISRSGLGGKVEWTRADELLVDPQKVGDAVRLAALLQFMAEKRLFSSFAGEPLEWRAFERMIRQSVTGQGDATPMTGEPGILKTDTDPIVDLASRHFNHVLAESLERMSFFRRTWTFGQEDSRRVAKHVVPLRGVLRVRGADIRSLVIDFHMPDGVELRETTVDGWLFGRLVGHRTVDHQGHRALNLHFRLSALVCGNWDEGGEDPVSAEVPADREGGMA